MTPRPGTEAPDIYQLVGDLVAGLHVPRSLGSIMGAPNQYDALRHAIGDSGWSTGDEVAAKLRKAIEREVIEQAVAAVEGLIAGAGGRCLRPDDYDPGEMNICVTHSELIFEDGCEDQPRELLAVLAALRSLEAEG